MKIDLSLEEIVVLVAVHQKMTTREAAGNAVDLLSSPKFDIMVALDTIHSLVTQKLLDSPVMGSVGPTHDGANRCRAACNALRCLLDVERLQGPLQWRVA